MKKSGKGELRLKAQNLLTIIAANIRMNYKYIILPAMLLLIAIPFIYGTTNLDCLKSADCLERMVALIGIPMFTGLVWQEHSHSLFEIIALRLVSFRFVVLLRIGLSAVCTLLLIFAFELYMCVCGCSFPFLAYALRTLAASMILGLTGLLISCISQNTISGYLGSFCLYFVVQMIDLTWQASFF
jgi:hypothetical protein